jgi:hypothetical protein
MGRGVGSMSPATLKTKGVSVLLDAMFYGNKKYKVARRHWSPNEDMKPAA